MSKGLLKKIVVAGSSILTFIFVLLIKVGSSLKSELGTSEKVKVGFFKFLSDTKEANVFCFARVSMWVGFILITIVMVYFITILVLHLLKQNKVLNKLNLATKIISVVSIFSAFLLLIAGLDNETIEVLKMTNNITLFGIPWLFALIFSVVPIVSDYLIKE